MFSTEAKIYKNTKPNANLVDYLIKDPNHKGSPIRYELNNIYFSVSKFNGYLGPTWKEITQEEFKLELL